LPSECLCCHEFSLFDGQLETDDKPWVYSVG
jgi:hypothetical protein